jgi:SAM-dependent methyltransferase
MPAPTDAPLLHLTAGDVALFLDRLTLPYDDDRDALAYHRTFARRYAHTLNLIAAVKQRAGLGDDARVLELGAAPYGMSALLRHHLFREPLLASFGPPGRPARDLRFVIAGEAVTMPELEFNAETDRWPLEDSSLDLAICCELIEHLAFDPAHVFAEANRVLRPNGRLLVSTPNAASLQNIVRLVAGVAPGLAPHYRLPATMGSLYSRHNRELTPRALAALFGAAGFALETRDMANFFPFDRCGLSRARVAALRALAARPHDRADTMTFVGRRAGPVAQRWPTEEMLFLAADVRALSV